MTGIGNVGAVAFSRMQEVQQMQGNAQMQQQQMQQVQQQTEQQRGATLNAQGQTVGGTINVTAGVLLQ